MSQTTQSVTDNTNNTTTTNTTTNTSTTERIVGQVKWFNNNLNYGFITIVTPNFTLPDGASQDVFVHQSHINPQRSTYRTLYKGEYVSFELTAVGDNGETNHAYQAVSVTGVEGGDLMCDISTQHPFRSNQRRNRRNYDNRDNNRRQRTNTRNNNRNSDNTTASQNTDN